MKTSITFNKVINDAGQLALTEGHTVLTSSPRVTPCGLLSFKGDIMKTQNRSQKIKNTKRKNNIKRLREEAEIFLHHISEIEKHHNNRGYHSVLFYDKYNKSVDNGNLKSIGTVGAFEDGNVPIDGTDISIEYLKAFKRLEGEFKEAFAKITI